MKKHDKPQKPLPRDHFQESKPKGVDVDNSAGHQPRERTIRRGQRAEKLAQFALSQKLRRKRERQSQEDDSMPKTKTDPAMETAKTLGDINETREAIQTKGEQLRHYEDLRRRGVLADDDGISISHKLDELVFERERLAGRMRVLQNEIKLRVDAVMSDPATQARRDAIRSQVQTTNAVLTQATIDLDQAESALSLFRQRVEDGNLDPEFTEKRLAELEIDIEEKRRIKTETLDALGKLDERVLEMRLDALGLSNEPLLRVVPANGHAAILKSFGVFKAVCHPGRVTPVPAVLERAARALIDEGTLVAVD